MLDLIDGDPKNAVSLLREAHTQRPSDPRFLNDLAAASLALYDDTGDPWAALEAVEVAAQADRLEPSAPARFNLAFALERLNVRVRAIAAWERYLELDSRSSWAQEAEQHLEGLKAAVAKSRKSPQLTATPAANVTDFPDNPWARRQLGERVLLTRWAERTLAHQPVEAEDALIQAERLATTLTADGGRLLTASIDAIREAEEANDRTRIDLLAHGHQAFGQAFLKWREEHAAEARSLSDIAILDLQEAKTPFELRARLLRAWMVEEPDWDELGRISDEAEAGSFAAIIAEERRIAAYQITLEGRKKEGAYAYRSSQQRFVALGESEAAAILSAMRAESLTELRWNRESGVELAATLKAGPSLADPWSRYSIYVVSSVAVSNRFSHAAVELRLEAADACRSLPERPLCGVDSWLQVASLTPDVEVAEVALQRAGDLLARAPNSEGKERTKTDLVVARATWLGKGDRSGIDQRDAADLYADAADQYDERHLAVSAAYARSQRAKILSSLGQAREAAAAYQRALKTFRLWDQEGRFRPDQVEKLSPSVLRDAYEGLIVSELNLAGNGVSPAAFLLSEEMSDRLVFRQESKFHQNTLDEILRFASSVPRGTALIEYAILGDFAAAWILVNGSLDQVVIKIQPKIGDRIDALVTERNLKHWKSETGSIYREFLVPVLRRLPTGTERLVIVPDSYLYGVPFRALWDPETGHYMDESFTISFATSIGQLLEAKEERPSERAQGVLSIGFSRFLPQLYLRQLPRAEGEAAAVLGVYGFRQNACQVTDWSSFRNCAPRADVIHLATHASGNSDQSWLAFPGETVGVGKLWRELPNFSRHPLVILAACQTTAVSQAGEGFGGLARPFLAKGAKAVVGVLWEMDDSDLSTYFLHFHENFIESWDEARSQRLARRQVEGWAARPWAWGGIETISRKL